MAERIVEVGRGEAVSEQESEHPGEQDERLFPGEAA
jgi:hypothetical protein